MARPRRLTPCSQQRIENSHCLSLAPGVQVLRRGYRGYWGRPSYAPACPRHLLRRLWQWSPAPRHAPSAERLRLSLSHRVSLSAKVLRAASRQATNFACGQASSLHWLRLLLAAAQQDREGCLRRSLELGYLTSEENDVGRSIYDFLPLCDIWPIERLDHE